MLREELVAELRRLSREDKQRVMDLLRRELDAESDGNVLDPDRHYEIWSPYDSAGAAQQLKQLLDEAREQEDEQ